jgi:hypothetical protein
VFPSEVPAGRLSCSRVSKVEVAARVDPSGQRRRQRQTLAGGGGDADVLGAGAGGKFLGRPDAVDLERQRKAARRQRGGSDRNPELVPGKQWAQVSAEAVAKGQASCGG